MYSWGVNASSPCSFSRMPRSFTMPFCSCAKEGGRSDRARPWAASDPRRVTFARKTGAERRAAREPRSRAYRRVSRGRACMKSHPSSRFMTLRSFIIPDAARRARAVSIRKELALSPVTQQVLTRSQARTSPLETLCRVSRVRVTTETPNTRVVRRTSEPRQLARCFTVAPRGRARAPRGSRKLRLGFRAKSAEKILDLPRNDETGSADTARACFVYDENAPVDRSVVD